MVTVEAEFKLQKKRKHENHSIAKLELTHRSHISHVLLCSVTLYQTVLWLRVRTPCKDYTRSYSFLLSSSHLL